MVWVDEYWIDPDLEIPYYLNIGQPLNDLEERFENFWSMPKIAYQAMNPYALGHKINHPPPDKEANVLFVDFNIPMNWFPSSFWKFIPYV